MSDIIDGLDLSDEVWEGVLQAYFNVKESQWRLDASKRPLSVRNGFSGEMMCLLDVSPLWNVATLKTELATRLGIPVSEQRLLDEGNTALKDGDLLSQVSGAADHGSLFELIFIRLRIGTLTENIVEASMANASEEMKPWIAGDFVRVKKLQDAVRNHGRVDLMRMQSAGGRQVAVTQIPTSWLRGAQQEFRQEYPAAIELPWVNIGIVKELGYQGFPYCCDLLGMYRDERCTYIVCEFATDGDMFERCSNDATSGFVRELMLRPLVIQLIDAVRWLHDAGVAHRDLSLENILVTRCDELPGKQRIKIIDYGMATTKRYCCNEVRGKLSYQAPEMHLRDRSYDSFLADAFQVGVAIYSMVAKDYPWRSTKSDHGNAVFNYVCRHGLASFFCKKKQRVTGEHMDRVFSKHLIDLLVALLQVNPDDRACLGESNFVARQSALDVEWLSGAGNELLRESKKTKQDDTITSGQGDATMNG